MPVVFRRIVAASLPAVVAMLALPAHAQNADAPLVTLGLKVWQNQWTSWDTVPPLHDARLGVDIPGASENFTSGSVAAMIPSVSVRYRDWLAAGSYFANKSYGFSGNGGAFRADRREGDGLVGYFVLPTLALTAGYKSVQQDFGGGAKLKYTGPTLGVVASAPLTQGFSLYGNVGYGFMKARLPARGADASGNTRFDASYVLGEVGIAYSFDVRQSMPSVRSLAATVGYRSQVLATQDYKIRISDAPPRPTRETDLRDTTEGLAFGVSMSF